jgi:DNA (cytosine-5)-methyltransferase 1
VVSGGFPCQDISIAGRGSGIEGERSGLWREMARIVGEVRPGYVFVENSPMLLARGFDRVLGDLVALGYDCAWRVLSAADLGLPHKRERLWVVGADPDRARLQGRRAIAPGSWSKQQFERLLQDQLRLAVPAGRYGGVADGVAERVGALRALGNGQVPRVAAAAFNELSQRLAKD